MGLYFRKSFGFGPFKLNLSKSGLGASVGVRGARVSTGPRGTYVNVGAGGVYFRQKLDAKLTHPHALPVREEQRRVEVGTQSVSDVAGDDLAKELKVRFRREAVSHWVVLAGSALSVGAGVFLWDIDHLLSLTALPIVVITIVLGIVLSNRDEERLTTVIEYRLDETKIRAYELLSESLLLMAAPYRAWEVFDGMGNSDWKRHAGASTLINRKPATVASSMPPRVSSDVLFVGLSTPRHRVYFLPDRLLLYWHGAVHSFAYDTLSIDIGQGRFVEELGVATGTTVVDNTWRFVNKNGSPDRRFNNNRELPVCLYGQLQITNDRGLQIVLQTSRADAPAAIRQGISTLAHARITAMALLGADRS